MKITILSILNSKGVSKQAKGEAVVDWGHSDFKITKLANELCLVTYSSCFILNFQPWKNHRLNSQPIAPYHVMVFGGGFYEEAITCGHRLDPIQIWHRLALFVLEKLGHRHAQGGDLQKTQRKEIYPEYPQIKANTLSDSEPLKLWENKLPLKESNMFALLRQP